MLPKSHERFLSYVARFFQVVEHPHAIGVEPVLYLEHFTAIFITR